MVFGAILRVSRSAQRRSAAADAAVRAAVESGELSEDRYANYLKLRKEVAFNEMSGLERRQKDAAFGKYLKQFKKQKGPNNHRR